MAVDQQSREEVEACLKLPECQQSRTAETSQGTEGVGIIRKQLAEAGPGHGAGPGTRTPGSWMQAVSCPLSPTVTWFFLPGPLLSAQIETLFTRNRGPCAASAWRLGTFYLFPSPSLRSASLSHRTEGSELCVAAISGSE